MKEELKEIIGMMTNITKYGIIGVCIYLVCKFFERPATIIITWVGLLIAIKIICSTIISICGS